MFVIQEFISFFWYFTFGLSLLSIMIKASQLQVYVTGEDKRLTEGYEAGSMAAKGFTAIY